MTLPLHSISTTETLCSHSLLARETALGKTLPTMRCVLYLRGYFGSLTWSYVKKVRHGTTKSLILYGTSPR